MLWPALVILMDSCKRCGLSLGRFTRVRNLIDPTGARLSLNSITPRGHIGFRLGVIVKA